MAGHLMPTMPALRHAAISFLTLFVTPLGLHAAWWLSTDAALAWSNPQSRQQRAEATR